MTLKDLSKKNLIMLVTKIANGLENTGDARDFCAWLSAILEIEANLKVKLSANLGYESGGISLEELREHIFQYNLPSSDSRKRD